MKAHTIYMQSNNSICGMCNGIDVDRKASFAIRSGRSEKRRRDDDDDNNNAKYPIENRIRLLQILSVCIAAHCIDFADTDFQRSM